MASGNFVAYYRVSTARQGISGLGLEAQKTAVLNYLDGGRWKLVAELTEIESGRKNERPELARALSLCRIHKATLIIAKLDRLARNVAFISNLMEAGVEFTAVDFPQANRLTVHILAAVAEHEAGMISQRTKAALAAAKARGVALGGDRGGLNNAARSKAHQRSLAVRREQAAKRNADLLPVVDSIRASGATTLQQIADGLNARRIPTARGGAWQPVQVKRLIAQEGH